VTERNGTGGVAHCELGANIVVAEVRLQDLVADAVVNAQRGRAGF
jgi:hypothetical protein